jgi:hypothetical protein
MAALARQVAANASPMLSTIIAHYSSFNVGDNYPDRVENGDLCGTWYFCNSRC